MSVDKFGRYKGVVRGGAVVRGPPGEGFKLTQDGNYDLERRRLCNVGDSSLAENDAVTLKVLAQKINESQASCNSYASEADEHLDRMLRGIIVDKSNELAQQVAHTYTSLKTYYDGAVKTAVGDLERKMYAYVDENFQTYNKKAAAVVDQVNEKLVPAVSDYLAFKQNFAGYVNKIVDDRVTSQPQIMYMRPGETYVKVDDKDSG